MIFIFYSFKCTSPVSPYHPYQEGGKPKK